MKCEACENIKKRKKESRKLLSNDLDYALECKRIYECNKQNCTCPKEADNG